MRPLVLCLFLLPLHLQAADKIVVNGAGKFAAAENVVVADDSVQLDGKNSVPVAEIDDILFPRAATLKPTTTVDSYSEITLVNGSVLRVAKFEFGKEQSKFWLWNAFAPSKDDENAAFTVDSKSLRSFLRNANDPVLKKQFENLIASAKNFDRLVFRVQDDRLDAVDITVEELATKEGKLAFVNQGLAANDKVSTIPWSRPAGLLLQNREASDAATPLAFLTDHSGNKLAVKRFRYSGSRSELEAAGNVTVPALFAQQLQRVDYGSARGVPLASLPAQLDAPRPSDPLGRAAYSRNETIAGDKLLLAVKKGEEPRTFTTGICLAVGTTLRISLGKKFRSMAAFVGVDARSAVDAKGTLELSADGKVVANVPFQSDGFATPVRPELDAAETLTLRVKPDDLSDVGSTVCLGGALLHRPTSR